jgi:hypothetical protein
MAYYMGGPNRHKSAISITLDNNVLDFFSGKGRSGKINYILTQYLQWKLGAQTAVGFNESNERAPLAAAVEACKKIFGEASLEAEVMNTIYLRAREASEEI